MWKQEDLNKPLTFPLRNQAGQSSWSALTNAMADPPSNQDSAYASQSSSRVSQLSPYSSGMRNGNGLVYEQVFQYSKGSDPSQGYSIYGTGSDSGQATYPQESSRSYDSIQEMPSFHFQTNTAAYPSGMENQSSGPTGYYQRFFQVPQKAVSWGVSDPVIPPAPPPPSYITQSRNGYERMRYSHTHTKYSPDPYAPTPMSQDTKAPPPQQADPGVAKEPQRYSTFFLNFSLEWLLSNWSLQKWSNQLCWSPRTKW